MILSTLRGGGQFITVSELLDFVTRHMKMLKNILMLLATLLTLDTHEAFAAQDLAKTSNIKADERVVFFTTDAIWLDQRRKWMITIHAWVHELENASTRRAAIAAFVQKKYALSVTPENKKFFDRRTRLLLADNERNKRLVIQLGDNVFTLQKTQKNGHSLTSFELDADLVAQHQVDGRLKFSAVLDKNDDRSFAGYINLIPAEGISVISDIDDTVKFSNVTDRVGLIEQTFYREFLFFPGMVERYAAWSAKGALFHYVSSSPWQLYEPLDQTMDAYNFPRRSMSLKYFRFRDATLLNLFKPGTETKPMQIQAIVNAHPKRRFLLVGDSGEQDPEVYADILRQFPQRIVGVYIRNITKANRSDERFSHVFKDIDPDKWRLFEDPSTLVLPE